MAKRVSKMSRFTTTPHLRLLNASTGVASVYMSSGPEDAPVIEFHARQISRRHSGAARVHHCLLRIKSDSPGLYPKGLKPPFGNIISRFAYLETVVVETGRGFETDDVQSLIEALHDSEGGGVEVQHRTSDEAHKLALQAKKSPSRSMGASPFWCLQWNTDEWDKW